MNYEMIFPIITTAGLVVFIVTWGMLAMVAFKTKIWWGLGYTTLPLVGLLFLYLNWGSTKRTSLIHLAGLAMTLGGYQIAEGF